MSEPATNSSPAPTPLPLLPHIVRVEPDVDTHTLLATFATGERRRYDVTPLLDRGIFRRLCDDAAFRAVGVDELGGVVWEAGPDLSRDTIYLNGERSCSIQILQGNVGPIRKRPARKGCLAGLPGSGDRKDRMCRRSSVATPSSVPGIHIWLIEFSIIN